METFLGYGADTNITTDGNGNLSMASAILTHGAITRIAFGFASVVTTGTVITHNLGVTPGAILLTTSAAGITAYASSTTTTTTFTAFVSTNNNIWWLAIA